MRFEYLTTFVPVFYQEEEGGGWLGIGKKISLPRIPIIESLTGNPGYEEQLNRLGSTGWELVNVQPLLRGVREAIGYQGIAYSLTAGYYLFWKRSLNEE
jgi:hypothetical protein